MFREIIRGIMYEHKVSVKQLSSETGIRSDTISSFLTGGRGINYNHLETILDTMGLTLVPKKGFKFEHEESGETKDS